MKVIMVGGYPGSGKSTIFKRLFEKLASEGITFQSKKVGIVTYMESKEIIVLGSYAPEETFPGTDRLPLNVQPEAQKFVAKLASKAQPILLLEGDRLFNDKMLTFFKGLPSTELVLCIVTMERGLLESRRQARSEQNESWRKGRETKVDRIAMTYPVAHYLTNNGGQDIEKCAQELYLELKGEWKSDKPSKSKIKDLWS